MIVQQKGTEPQNEEAASPDRGTVLIVEDDVLQARALERAIRRHFTPKVAHTRTDGLRDLGEINGLRAAVIDVKLTDGSGMDVAEEARKTMPRLPIFVITGYLKPEIVNRVFDINGRFLAKPLEARDLESMTDSILHESATGIRERLNILIKKNGLNAGEGEVLALALSGLSRQDIAAKLETSPNTIKSRAKKLLKKCGASNINQIIIALLTEESLSTMPEPPLRSRREKPNARTPISGRRKSSGIPPPGAGRASPPERKSDPP
jgi:DNA-binding NarL/FixJ family response regulator